MYYKLKKLIKYVKNSKKNPFAHFSSELSICVLLCHYEEDFSPTW